MIKEAKALVRIIALWIIFLGSLYMTFLAVGNFVGTTVTLVNGGYDYYGGYSNPSFNCMISPLYPTFQNETVNTAELSKYQVEQEAYSKRTQELCEQDQQTQKETALKSEQSQKNQNQASGRSAVAREAILMAIGFAVIFISLREIRKIEQV